MPFVTTRLMILGASFSALFVVGLSSAFAQYKIEVGKPHPDFVLPRIDNGEPMSPASFLGKKVLLINFASW